MRFETIEDINKPVVLGYIKEAIANQKLGRELKPIRTAKKDVVIPDLVATEIKMSATFNVAFNALTPSCQREYCNYIIEAKREATKLSRLDKIKPVILKGGGLHDKYKNC